MNKNSESTESSVFVGQFQNETCLNLHLKSENHGINLD